MVILRAFGLTQFSGSQQTRSASASNAWRHSSTRFLQTKGRHSGIWDNCRGPAWGTPYRRRASRFVVPRAGDAHTGTAHANAAASDARDTEPYERAASLRSYGADKGARRE